MKIPPMAPMIPIGLSPIAPPQHKLAVEVSAVEPDFKPTIYPGLDSHPTEIIFTDIDMMLGRLKTRNSDLHWTPNFLN